MEDGNCYLYCHTNKINGKKYIGISYQTPSMRWRKGKGYVNCKKFYNAIKKYGWDNFTHEILLSNLTMNEASEKEKEYIKLFNTIDNGYNYLDGGIDGLSDYLSKPVNQYTLDKVFIKKWDSAMDVERELGYQHSAITATCRRQHKTSHNFIWRYADDCDDINDVIIKNTNKYKTKTSLTRKVNQYDLYGNLIKQWDNLLQVAHCLNKTTTMIYKCCERVSHCHTAYGYQWRYADDCLDIKARQNKLIYEVNEKNDILCVYENILEIKQKYSNENLWVSDVLTHKYKKTHGHMFVYADEYIKRE